MSASSARSGDPIQIHVSGPRSTIGNVRTEAVAGTPARQFLEALLLARGLNPPLQICEMVTFPLAERMVLESDAIALLT